MNSLKRLISLLAPLLLKVFTQPKPDARTGPTNGRKRSTTRNTPSAAPKPPRAKRRSSPTASPTVLPTVSPKAPPRPPRAARRSRTRTRSPVAELHAARKSGVLVTDSGIVVKMLPDDNEGSRHQRMLVEVDHSDITIKIAHNIDLAPRVPCREGDRVTFHGEYEWNDLGGAIHWTHHDPKKWREGGWVEAHGKRYE